METNSGIRACKMIVKKMHDRGIVVKHFLRDLQLKYPEERGLTENGFKYSLRNGTIKLNLFILVMKELQVGLEDIFRDENGIFENLKSFQGEKMEAIEKRIRELETDKEILIKTIHLMEIEKIFENQKNDRK